MQLLRLESLRQIPQLAVEKIAAAEATSLMGMWPEIHRAWAAFDDELLIWNYEEDVPEGGIPTDYRLIRGLGAPILSVGLVPPRADVFDPIVKVRPPADGQIQQRWLCTRFSGALACRCHI